MTPRTIRLESRDTELAQLDAVFHELRAGRGRIVFLSGEPGVGKTALAKTFLHRAENGRSRAIALSTQCVRGLTGHRPYGALRELLALLGGIREGPDLAAAAAENAPAWLPGARQAPGRNALFSQYVQVWRTIGAERPVILLIDDIQWIDRSSLDLLSRLSGALSSLPLLLVTTYEPVESNDAVSLQALRRAMGANALELALRPLEDGAVENLFESVLDAPLKGELGERLARLCDGNPLYAEQAVRWFADRGSLRRRLFRYTAKEDQLPPQAPPLETVIWGRLDSVEPGLRWTLEAASLAGSVADSAVIAGQLAKRTAEVEAELESAARDHDLLEHVGQYRWAGGRSTRYRFRHPVMRRLLSDRVTGKRRVHLLCRAAETIETLAGEGADALADEIAALYLAAGAAPRIHAWCCRAASLAERLYAPYELEEFLRTAARHAPEAAQRLRLENRLARLFAATGREPEAEQLLEAVFQRASELEDREIEVGAGATLGWLQLERGVEPAKLSALSGRLVDAGRSSESAEQLVPALDLACVVAERIGRAEEALLMAEEALHVAEGSENPELVAQAAYRLARVHIYWGDPQEGRALAERALGTFTEVNAAGGVAACHDLLGLASFRSGDWDDALHHWTSALERLEVAGVPEQKVVMQANIAELRTFRGDFQEAKHLFQGGLELAEELEDPTLVLRCRTGIARLEYERGNYATVLELTERIRDVLPKSGAWREDFHTTAIRALSYLELGDELQAWQEAARLEQLYQGKEGWFERRAEGDAVRIRVIDLDSDDWLAGMVAEQGIGETTDKDLYGEGFLQYHRACVLSESRPAEARQAAERAEELFSKLSAEPMLNRARTLLESLPAVEVLEEEPGDEEFDEEKLDQWFDSLEG